MIKFTQGSITNSETGIKKDVVVKAASPNNVRDILIGSALIIGGVLHLTVTAFKKGSQAHDDAEFKVFEDLDLFVD